MKEGSIILLNYGHPLTRAHLSYIQAIIGRELEIREFSVHFDPEQSFAEQVAELINVTSLSSTEWQGERLLINPPAHNLFALVLLAELHGRMGYFPAVIRLKPINGALPLQFEVAEIVNLQVIRDNARARR